MPSVHFTADAKLSLGLEARSEAGYRTVLYSGNLGGGTLRISTVIDGYEAWVPDSKLTAATVDDNGDVVKMISFSASGNILVSLTGSTAPDVYVAGH